MKRFCLLRAYRGLKQERSTLVSPSVLSLLRAYRGLKQRRIELGNKEMVMFITCL